MTFILRNPSLPLLSLFLPFYTFSQIQHFYILPLWAQNAFFRLILLSRLVVDSLLYSTSIYIYWFACQELWHFHKNSASQHIIICNAHAPWEGSCWFYGFTHQSYTKFAVSNMINIKLTNTLLTGILAIYMSSGGYMNGVHYMYNMLHLRTVEKHYS